MFAPEAAGSPFLRLSGHGHKGDTHEVLHIGLGIFLSDEGEGLKIGGASQRNNKPSSLFQLFDQRRRNMVGGAGDDDGVKGGEFLPPKISISILYAYFFIAEFLQMPGSGLGQRLPNFD